MYAYILYRSEMYRDVKYGGLSPLYDQDSGAALRKKGSRAVKQWSTMLQPLDKGTSTEAVSHQGNLAALGSEAARR
jgi:hypothetical protein